jgi:hypothetical protein
MPCGWFNQFPEVYIQIHGRDKSQKTYKLSGEDIDLDHPNLERLQYLYVPYLSTVCSPGLLVAFYFSIILSGFCKEVAYF